MSNVVVVVVSVVAVVVAFATVAVESAHVFSISQTFPDDVASSSFVIGEFAALLEACASPTASNRLKRECLRGLATREFACHDEQTTCVVDGTHVEISSVSFACDGGACPSSNPTFDPYLSTTTEEDCAFGPVNGYVGSTCHSSARCQWLAERPNVASFGEYCPSATGEYCCASNATRDETTFDGVPMMSSSSTIDYMQQLSHVTDLSFRVHYDVQPPSLVRVVVDAPYVTSDRTMTFYENGALKTYAMCPSAYMFDFADPVEPLPRAEDGYYRRASAQTSWLPLRFYPALDLVGRPRSPCGNYDFQYGGSPEAFRDAFGFPDLLTNASTRFAYGPTPAVDPDAWAGLEGVAGVPSGANTFWTMGEPANGRVNYTAGYWDLVSGFYRCRDHETGAPLVSRESEGNTYIGGVGYEVESYSWTLHLCQVGYFGPNCADTSTIQSYAKTCATIPSTFAVAPRQVSHVDTTPTSSGLVSKSFLRSVSSVRGGCPIGSERVAVAFTLLVFETEYTIVNDTAHAVAEPRDVFEGNQTGVALFDASHATSTRTFLASNPTVEGMYALAPFVSSTSGADVLHRTIVVVTRCFDTGHDPASRTRARGDAFAKAASDGHGRVRFQLEVSLQKNAGPYVVKNALTVRVLGTEDTFVLRDVDVMEQKGARANHALYANYETAAADASPSFPNALPSNSEVVMFAGDQLCSKQQLVEGDAHGTALRPNAVGACVLSAKGEAATDGDGVPVAGREIFYRTTGMSEPAPYVFGCFRDWIDVSDASPTSAGVYEMPVLRRLPDENHESDFWFVVRGELSRTELPGTGGTTIADRFGTGLFAYDETANDGAGSNVADVSSEMQRDPLTTSASLDVLSAGCSETAGNLRAACNLACFDVEEGLLTSTTHGENRTLVVHHVSVATVVDADGSAARHRFGGGGDDVGGGGSIADARRRHRRRDRRRERRRRRDLLLLATDDAIGGVGGVGGVGGRVETTERRDAASSKNEGDDAEGTRSLARKIRVIARERHREVGSGGGDVTDDDGATSNAVMWTIAWTIFGCALFVAFAACAFACARSESERWSRRGKKRNRKHRRHHSK